MSDKTLVCWLRNDMWYSDFSLEVQRQTEVYRTSEQEIIGVFVLYLRRAV